jgi:hypothetical protein
MRIIRIGMVGTFDVANFGDLLFPLLARHELSKRLGPVEIRTYSYNARDETAWPFAVTALERLPAEIGSLDLLLIGGGDIIRFDPLVALDYRPNSPDIHHPSGFWLAPIFLAHTARVPVAWNAPGLPREIPPWASSLVRAGVAVSSYVSVRDHGSREFLERATGSAPVTVVPDSAFGAAGLLPDRPRAAGYLVLQSRPHATEWVGRVRELLPDDDLELVFAPVGPALGDLIRPPAELPAGATFRAAGHPLEMLGLIAGSSGVVGPSLHLAITALAFGRPVLRPTASRLSKYSMFRGLRGVHEMDAGKHDAIDGAALLPDPGQLLEAHRQLERHWDTIAGLAVDSAATTRQPRKWEPMMMDCWQRLPSQLERTSRLSRLRTELQIVRTRMARYRDHGTVR